MEDIDIRALLMKLPSKLKMVECKILLGCKEAEWTEIGLALLEITKEFELSSLSWASQRYEDATNDALERIPILKTLLLRVKKDERYRHELVKRMITVKAKKQTELEIRRRNRSAGRTPNGHTSKASMQRSTMSLDSRTPSPEPGEPASSDDGNMIPYHRDPEPVIPKPFQHTKPIFTPSEKSRTVSLPSAQPSTEISDIFMAQTQQYVAAFKNLQETLRRRDGEIYGLQSKVIELERQLERYRRAEGRENEDIRGKVYRR